MVLDDLQMLDLVNRLRTNPATPRKSKFKFNPIRLSLGLLIGDVSTGQCDFDEQQAVQGRKVSSDVFYLCQHHANLIAN